MWLTYQPTLPEDQVEVLQELGADDYMIVSPLVEQGSAVVAPLGATNLSSTAPMPRL